MEFILFRTLSFYWDFFFLIFPVSECVTQMYRKTVYSIWVHPHWSHILWAVSILLGTSKARSYPQQLSITVWQMMFWLLINVERHKPLLQMLLLSRKIINVEWTESNGKKIKGGEYGNGNSRAEASCHPLFVREKRLCLMSPSRQNDLRVSTIKGTVVIDMATYQNRACELS